MKSILLPVHPEILANVLDGNTDTLIKKLFPKDHVGWVYLYCTKKPYLYDRFFGRHFRNDNAPTFIGYEPINGYVVARFWCDKVEKITSQVVNYGNDCLHTTETMNMTELLKTTCLSLKELDSYLGDKNGFAIHISKLEVFDKPRELGEFRRNCYGCRYYKTFKIACNNCKKHRLTKAPQTFTYVESEK